MLLEQSLILTAAFNKQHDVQEPLAKAEQMGMADHSSLDDRMWICATKSKLF